MTQASPPLRPGAALPRFELPDCSGVAVRSDRLLGALSLTLFLAGDGSDTGWLSRYQAVQVQVAAWGGTLLVVSAGDREAAGRLRGALPAPARVLADEGGALHRRLGEVDPRGRPAPALLVFERGGVLRCRVAPPAAESEWAETLEWIRYLGIIEPECSTCIPAWPEHLLDEVDTPTGKQ